MLSGGHCLSLYLPSAPLAEFALRRVSRCEGHAANAYNTVFIDFDLRNLSIKASNNQETVARRLRIWGSEVRILPGAPVYETSRVNRTAFTRPPHPGNREQARPTIDDKIVTCHGTVMPNVEVDAVRAFSGHELGLPIWVRIWSAARPVTCLSLPPGFSLREGPCFLSRAWTVGLAWE